MRATTRLWKCNNSQRPFYWVCSDPFRLSGGWTLPTCSLVQAVVGSNNNSTHHQTAWRRLNATYTSPSEVEHIQEQILQLASFGSAFINFATFYIFQHY